MDVELTRIILDLLWDGYGRHHARDAGPGEIARAYVWPGYTLRMYQADACCRAAAGYRQAVSRPR